jgi:hypothetical protein
MRCDAVIREGFGRPFVVYKTGNAEIRRHAQRLRSGNVRSPFKRMSAHRRRRYENRNF